MVDGSDEDLIRRFHGGDEAALRRLFDRYEGPVRTRIDRRIPPDLRRKFSAEDILQETYLTVFRRFAEFEPRGDGSFGAWVARIALFKLREEIRRYRETKRRGSRREITRGHRPDTRWFLGVEPSPSQFAIGREMERRLEAALQALPADYREALTLVQGRRMALGEAAEVMGRSREAMKKLYARAVARLASLLES